MKKVYEKPVFVADTYQVANSIAACDYHIGDVDKQEKIDIELDKSYCAVGDKGHLYNKSPMYAELERSTTVFNDGASNVRGCECDWDGGAVTSPNGKTYSSFGSAFYGATAGNDNHIPAKDQQVFFS